MFLENEVVEYDTFRTDQHEGKALYQKVFAGGVKNLATAQVFCLLVRQ